MWEVNLGRCKILDGDTLGQNFYSLIYELSYCNFQGSRNKTIYKIIFFFYPLTLKFITHWENNTFWGSVCIFESDTVKSDCPIQISRKMMEYLKFLYRLLVYLTSFTVCSGNIKRMLWKMTSKL